MKRKKVEIFQNRLGFSCNVCVLSSEKGTILIDPGFYDRRIREYLMECGGLDAVLVTHSHWDHIYGLDRLMEDFPEAQVYHHVLDEGFSRDAHLNGSDTKGFSFVCETEMNTLMEGAYPIGGYFVRVIHTPGHTVGSCIYVLPEEDIVFAGDSVFFTAETSTYRPSGSMADLRDSYEKIRALPLPVDARVYCGHYESGTFDALLEYNQIIMQGDLRYG